MRFRFYYNGTLKKSSEVTKERGEKWLDNAQREWSKEEDGMGNKITYVNRTTDELEVHIADGAKLKWKLVD